MRAWMGVAAITAVGLAGSAIAATPAARIEAYDAAIVGVMKQRLPIKARADRFGELVEAYYDMPAIAAAVIGPAWSNTSAADRAALAGALARHSAISLARNF